MVTGKNVETDRNEQQVPDELAFAELLDQESYEEMKARSQALWEQDEARREAARRYDERMQGTPQVSTERVPDGWARARAELLGYLGPLPDETLVTVTQTGLYLNLRNRQTIYKMMRNKILRRVPLVTTPGQKKTSIRFRLGNLRELEGERKEETP